MGYAAVAAASVVVLLNVVGADRVGLFFDLSFVAICIVATLAIRPSDFFVAGVLPPLLMTGSVAALAIFDRTAVADSDDGFVQATVSGLAHHATALVIGYLLTLSILALRQVAIRNSGSLRRAAAATSPQARPAAPAKSTLPTQRNAGRDQRREVI